MESLKEFFRLDIILRQCLGGVAFYVTLYLESGHPLETDSVTRALVGSDKDGLTLIANLIVMFLTGVFLHAVQRGAFQVQIDQLREYVLKRKRREFLLYPRDSIKQTVRRLDRLSQERMCTELYNWGASVHSMYTVAVAILAAKGCVLIQAFPAYSIDCKSNYPLLIFIVGLFFFGFVGDCRKCIIERRLPGRKPPEQCMPAKTSSTEG